MKDLLKRTFAGSFNTDNFILFTKNLFNEIDIEPREISVSSGFGEHIKKFTYLGGYSDSQKRNIDVLVVELIGDTKVERARSFQRNLVAKFLKDNTKDAGLVAFYSADNPDWRLSFVKMDYRITDKGVKVEVGTPPKRYSFLVGETEPSHTAQKQLFPILNDRKNNPLISELEEAFSVEKVTREFYEKYRALFEKLAKNLKKNKSFQIIASKENIDIDNFAKKLLGQIVFLYFLQKKGWLGVPSDKLWGQGDKLFLRTLFDKAKCENKNFYNDYLERLFYDTLNNPRRDEVDPSYSRYFDSKIPFLNGGLFEPDYDWANTIVYLENDIFEDIIDTFDLYNFTVKEDEPLEKEVAVDPEMLGKVFENLLPENLRKGQGAFYTPREIVHYMCQESLINYLATETKIDIDKIRKLVVTKDFQEQGSWGFVDRALQEIKVCDPACGSGAFLVGMLHEIVSARRLLNHEEDEYHLKKETIQNCIYGVDIDPGAVEIAKLRLWLSLVVDYELKDIEPLPNLDYKIMCGNSLLEELVIGDETIKLFDEKLLNAPRNKKSDSKLFSIEGMEQKSGSVRNEYLLKLVDEKQKQIMKLHADNQLTHEKRKLIEQEIAAINKELNPQSKRSKTLDYHPTLFIEDAEKYFVTLKELHKQYFTEYDPVKKKDKRRQIGQIELEFIKSSIQEKVNNIDTAIRNLNMQLESDRKNQAVLLKQKLDYLAIPEKIHNSKVRPYFLWKLNFSEVFQDNSGFDVVIANPPYFIEKDNHEAFSAIKTTEFGKNFYEGRMDYFYFFIEKTIRDFINSEGVMAYITTHYWPTSSGAKKLRAYIRDKVHVIKLVNFNEVKIFETAQGQHNLIIVGMLKKNDNKNIPTEIIVMDKLEKKQVDSINIEAMLSGALHMPGIVKYTAVEIFDNSSNLTAIQANPASSNIRSKIEKDSLHLLNEDIGNGIDILQETVTKKHLDKKKNFVIGAGIFILSKDEIEKLNLSLKEKEYVKPFYSNDIVSRYCATGKTDRYIIYANGEFINNVEKYPNLRKHLDKYKSIMTSAYGPYGLNRPREERYFKGEKLLVCRMTDRPIFSYIETDSYVSRTFLIIKPKQSGVSIKYLAALFNSKLSYYWFYNFGKRKGNILQIDKEPLMAFPIKIPESFDPFEKLVDKVISLQKSSINSQNEANQNKIKEYEHQMDEMIYVLYNLNQNEIDIVEKDIPK